MAYALIKHILQEAGFYHEVRGEILAGAVDGSNKLFSTENKRLFEIGDRDDGLVLPTDVVVYVDGLIVLAESIDARSGIITLANAPASGAVVKADYAYSNVDIDYAIEARAEATDLINSYMSGFDSRFPYPAGLDEKGNSQVPAAIRGYCRLYAGGLLLIRDYGYNTDLALTSKDGYYKMKVVKGALIELQRTLANSSPDATDSIDSPNSGIGAIQVETGGDFAGSLKSERPCSDCLEC